MSETSHAAGRIAILVAFTLLFAVAWRGDKREASPPVAMLTASKRTVGCAIGAGCAGCIHDAMDELSPVRFRPFGTAGRLAPLAANTPAVVSPFSGRPALLGRSTLPVSASGDAVTAAAINAETPLQ